MSWRTFNSSRDQEELDNFLEDNAPSKVKKSDGVVWISVRRPRIQDDQQILESNEEVTDEPSAPLSQEHQEDQPLEDLNYLDDFVSIEEAWEDVQTSDEVINFDTVIRLAKEHKCLSGKWLFYMDTGANVDGAWEKVARGIVSGQLGRSAKVSSCNDVGSGQKNHVICVYSEDFTDQKDVYDLENGLRNVGIQCSMMYKPDAFTSMGIYSKNKWNLKPTIYTSKYDMKLKKSNIIQHNSSSSAGGKTQQSINKFFCQSRKERKRDIPSPLTSKTSPAKKTKNTSIKQFFVNPHTPKEPKPN